MAGPVDSAESVGPDDVALTAWLDDELSPEERAALDRRLAAEPQLRSRLDFLRHGDRPFVSAYAELLAVAPTERLSANFAKLVADRDGSGAAKATWWQTRRFAAIAAALVVFAAGAVAGYVVPRALEPAPAYPGWRQVVAEYHALISPETLAVMNQDQAELATELVAVGERMALDLSPERIGLPDATLKRVQLYDYNGRPLVQLVYDSPAVGPFALCILSTDRPNTEISFEERVGSNIVYWYKDGRGYLLIAKGANRDQLETYAGDIAARFS
jgi:anti-sigma factor RsiW